MRLKMHLEISQWASTQAKDEAGRELTRKALALIWCTEE
jgi:hypothetical protein